MDVTYAIVKVNVTERNDVIKRHSYMIWLIFKKTDHSCERQTTRTAIIRALNSGVYHKYELQNQTPSFDA